MGKILEARDLHFSWSPAGEKWFQGLNLVLQGGHIYGLMGRNGAGKTTLIKLLCGALRPQAGETLIEAQGRSWNTARRHPEALAETVFVAESVELPPVSVEEFGRITGPLYPHFSQELYRSHLQAFEVPMNQLIPRLSFGQRRKVHIAFALASRAALVFLDEPSNGLDIGAQIVLRQLLISELTAERSVVVSTHHVREFEHVIDEVLVLEHGRILAHETLDELQSQAGYLDLESWYARLIGLVPSTPSSRSPEHELV